MRFYTSSVTVFALLLSLTFGLSADAAGLKVPDVPVTGGKKQARASDGKVDGVEMVAGLGSAKPITWEEMAKSHFDMSHTLPYPRPQELTATQGLGNKINTTVDIGVAMKRFAAKKFDDPKYAANEEWVKSVGNIIAEFKAIKGNSKKTDELLAKLQTTYPVIYAEIQSYLVQLVRDDFIYSAKWDPYKDESVKGKQNDGILFVDQWVIQNDPSRNPIWNKDPGEHKVYQGATLIYADVQTIKEMEKDYAKYFDQIGQNYLEVYPVPNTYFRGIDAKGNDFVRMDLFLRNDLPFPFDSAAYVMNILEHYSDDGYLLADYYSDNKADLNWMAGRDLYIPITTTKGELVGNMLVTVLDFDIKSVPERDIDRIISMKAGLGNMKRISEKLAEKKALSAAK